MSRSEYPQSRTPKYGPRDRGFPAISQLAAGSPGDATHVCSYTYYVYATNDTALTSKLSPDALAPENPANRGRVGYRNFAGNGSRCWAYWGDDGNLHLDWVSETEPVGICP